MAWYNGIIYKQKGNVLALDGIGAPFFASSEP